MAAVGLLLGSVGVVTGIGRWVFAYSNYGPAVVWRWSIPWLLGGVPALLLGTLAAAWLVRWSRLRIIIHQRGVRVLRGSREQAIPWEAIRHVYTSGVRYGVLGVMWGSRASLVLETEDRSKLRLNQTLEGLAQFIDHVKRSVYPRLLAAYTRDFHSGKGLPFGPIWLTAQGVRKGSRNLGWAEVGTARIRDGRLELTPKPGKKLGTLRAPAQDIPNVEICLQLIQHLMQRAAT